MFFTKQRFQNISEKKTQQISGDFKNINRFNMMKNFHPFCSEKGIIIANFDLCHHPLCVYPQYTKGAPCMLYAHSHSVSCF